MPVKIRFRRGTAAKWTAANPVLALAEMGLETDARRLKAGDGKTAWRQLPYLGGSDSTCDASDAAIAAETASRISADDAETAARIAADSALTVLINQVGVPAGGTTGQALVKGSNADYNTTWATISSGGLTNLDGGHAATVYGGTTNVDGGNA